MKGIWIVCLLSVATLLTGCAIPSSSAAPPVQTPGFSMTPPSQPYPGPGPIVQPTRRPPITYVIPTPPTPSSTTANIVRDQAIAKVMQENPSYADLQARGEIAVTATLTTWGEYSKNPRSPITSPTLPVWVVEIETKPWKRWVGPVGQQMQVTYRGFGYVVDGLTGNVLIGFDIPDGGK